MSGADLGILEAIAYDNGRATAYIDKDCNIFKPVKSAGVGLPVEPKDRKKYPIGTGFLDYFPLAAAEVAHVSYVGNEQHNPGMPVHWDRSKSGDEADALIRHFTQRGTLDSDGLRHSAKMAWRAMALLEKELEAARNIQKTDISS